MDWQENALPTLNSSDSRVKTYMARSINPLSPRRRWVTQRVALNAWMYHGRQWIESVGHLSAGQGVYHFREVFKQSLAAYKRPVTNIIAPAVDNEVARLTKKEYVPETATDKRHQDWLAAARLAKDYVTWEITKLAWRDKREHLAFNLCIDETAIARTYWDEDQHQMAPVGSTDARSCPSCESKLASPRLPASMIETGIPVGGQFRPFRGAETVKETGPVPQGAESYDVEVTHCPLCGEAELQPYDVDEQEAANGVDVLGNPLGRMLPKGDNGIEIVSVHQYYPENGGIGVEPHDARVHHQMTARPIEDVLKRYPHLEGKIQPDDPQKIMRLNPLYSDPGLATQGLLFGLAASGMDAYSNHVLVEECVVEPDSRDGLELGAHFVKVNEHLISRPLCVKVPLEDGGIALVPRVQYHICRQKRVPGMFWGRGFVSDLIPLQRRLNELDAQVIDLRERGKPMIWTPQGIELYFRRDTEGSLQVMEYEADLGWTPRDGLFPGIPMTGNPYMEERNQILVDAQLIGTPQDIELGRGVKSIKTTSGMMLAQEQAGERRAPRERGLVGLYEGIFQHVLDMAKTFRKDPTEYRVQSDAGIQELKSFEATELRGTVKVRMKAAAGFDQALYDKEAAAEAVNMGLYRLDDPLAVQTALQYMRLPDDVNENQKVQIRRAEMAWSDFMREKDVPLVDTSLYEPVIWFKVFQKRWMDDDCLILQQRARFSQTWARLAGWEDVYEQAEMLDFQQRQIYEAHPPEKWGELYGQAKGLYDDAVAQAQEADLFPPGPPPEGSGLETPPPPPPEEGFLPKAPEIRIYTVWQRILGPHLKDVMLAVEASKRVDVPINDDAEAAILLLDLLRMRAVIAAFRRIMQAQMMAMAPQPGAAAQPGQAEAAPAQ